MVVHIHPMKVRSSLNVPLRTVGMNLTRSFKMSLTEGDK